MTVVALGTLRTTEITSFRVLDLIPASSLTGRSLSTPKLVAQVKSTLKSTD